MDFFIPFMQGKVAALREDRKSCEEGDLSPADCKIELYIDVLERMTWNDQFSVIF